MSELKLLEIETLRKVAKNIIDLVQADISFIKLNIKPYKYDKYQLCIYNFSYKNGHLSDTFEKVEGKKAEIYLQELKAQYENVEQAFSFLKANINTVYDFDDLDDYYMLLSDASTLFNDCQRLVFEAKKLHSLYQNNGKHKKITTDERNKEVQFLIKIFNEQPKTIELSYKQFYNRYEEIWNKQQFKHTLEQHIFYDRKKQAQKIMKK